MLAVDPQTSATRSGVRSPTTPPPGCVTLACAWRSSGPRRPRPRPGAAALRAAGYVSDDGQQLVPDGRPASLSSTTGKFSRLIRDASSGPTPARCRPGARAERRRRNPPRSGRAMARRARVPSRDQRADRSPGARARRGCSSRRPARVPLLIASAIADERNARGLARLVHSSVRSRSTCTASSCPAEARLPPCSRPPDGPTQDQMPGDVVTWLSNSAWVAIQA